MCDYSLHSIKSRPAKIDDKLTTRDFGTGTRGFAASENPNVAVCVLPGTELAFIFAAEALNVGRHLARQGAYKDVRCNPHLIRLRKTPRFPNTTGCSSWPWSGNGIRRRCN